MENQSFANQLNNIEKQLNKLKILVAMRMLKKKKKLVSLKGMLNNLNISDEDVEEAKKSLFKTQ